MPKGIWYWQRLLLLKVAGVLVGSASTADLPQEAFLVRLQPDTLEWSAWITTPQLWTQAALPPSSPGWELTISCPAETLHLTPLSSSVEIAPPLEVVLCLDRSALATLSPSALRQILHAVAQSLRPEDRLVAIQYRYRAEAIHACTGQHALEMVDTMEILPAAGPAAPLHILQGVAEYCRQVPSHRLRIIVLCAEAPDQASFLVSAKDLLRTARQLALPLCILHSGTLGERSLWKALAAHTGGVYLWNAAAAPELLSWQLRRLLRGLQTHYRVRFPAPVPCSGLFLRFSSEQFTPVTYHQYPDDSVPEPPQLRTLCFFAAGDTTITDDAKPLLADLAQWLRAYPHEAVELIGHSGHTEKAADALAVQRARAVRRYLLQLGVSSRQLRIRSEGNRRPLSYFEQTVQQQRSNRRVEFRLLRPELLPYELTAGIAATEEHALRAVESWEARGYAAYYEPIFLNGTPAFRITLWGFATEREAERARTQIRHRYGVTVHP